MSSRRHGAPLIAYSLSPERNSVRVIVTSVRSMGNLADALSMVSDTSARPSCGRDDVPAKMTSSIFADRRERGPWAPSTQVTASTTFDLPLPFGPTTTVMPGSNSSTVGSAKDLNPFMLSDFRNISSDPIGSGAGYRVIAPLAEGLGLTAVLLGCVLLGRVFLRVGASPDVSPQNQ